MTPLQSWLSRPRASVRIDTTVPWAAWMRLLRRPFGSGKPDLRPRIEVLDRLALGVGEDAAPSIVHFESWRGGASNVPLRGKRSAVRGRKRVRG
jgi:hypothetical protein